MWPRRGTPSTGRLTPPGANAQRGMITGIMRRKQRRVPPWPGNGSGVAHRASAHRTRPVASTRAALALALLTSASAGAQTAQTPADGIKLFEENVRPVLEQNCFMCHSDPDRAENGFLLTTRAGLLRGGERGPAISTSEPPLSLLLEAVEYQDDQLQMPPSGRLADADIETIRQWVQLGAPFGGDEDDLTEVAAGEDEFQITDADRAWWSVRPLVRPDVPAVADPDWPLNPIDNFLLSRIEAGDLDPPPGADRRALIRRASYDLTGLPPTLEEVEAFEQDQRPDAWERLIDRLLASPHYGERWGRHWLDLVRYAETDGYERDRKKPSAWRYRDWVIDALNADMPYNEFLTHQLAGDEIDHPTAASIIATGYLRLGIWDDEPTDTALAQYDDLDSVLDTTSRVMLAMSIGCARCHNHRGDPIPQTDYYRMLSFFRGIAPYKVGGGNQPTPENYRDLIPQDLGSAEAEAEAERWRAERQQLLEAARSSAETLANAATAEELETARKTAETGLVAHLPLDEEVSLVAGDRKGRFHGRVEEAQVGADGVAGTAYTFDGENDSVRLPRPVADDFTVSLWFRTRDAAPGGVEFEWAKGSALVSTAPQPLGFGLSMIGNGYVVAGVSEKTDDRPKRTSVSSRPGYNDGHWHHAAFTRDGEAGALALFVDGVPAGEAKGNGNDLGQAPFLDLGRRGDDGHFAGSMDEVRFYDRVLSPREILSLAIDPATGGAALALAAGETPAFPGTEPARALGDAFQTLADHAPNPRKTVEVLRVKEIGPEAPPTHVLIRGNPHAPAERVEPGFPLILGNADPGLAERAADSPTTGRRRALAHWIADDGNLRTSRAMANRLWQYHFGRGLSPTPNDFGRFGREATHPDLLDWLATEFVARDWSLKSMHRLIMTSRAYQMSSRPPDGALEADPGNDLFSRFNMRRLTAEEIRDSVLAATGRLNLEFGGPSVYPPMPAEVLATASQPDLAWGDATPEQASRRSVYIHVKRSLLHPLLESLDMADTDSTCPVRFTTTQPTQALMMLNGAFMSEQAAALADRTGGSGGSLEDRVAEALRVVLARQPGTAEVARGVGLVEELVREEGFDSSGAFTSFSLLLLNLNEFVYLD